MLKPLLITSLALLACRPPAAADVLPQFPLPVPQERSAASRRAAKPAAESRLLDGMEALGSWDHHGPGTMTLTADHATEGAHALRIVAPTRLDQPGPTLGRPFAESIARRRVDRENWTGFNRVALDVFPHLPGFRVISMGLKFHAAGSERWAYTFGQLHYLLLEPDRWNHVVWEIPHLPREAVTGLDLIYRLQGNEPGATEQVRFDFDNLRLERVEQPDPFRGWIPAPDDLAYCHLGYLPDAPKTAIAAAEGPESFTLHPAAGGSPVFTGSPTRVAGPDGPVALLDFSDHRTPGDYVLRFGSRASAPFRIATDVWTEAAVATLNHYRCQRCGEQVPGIHDACHLDWMVVHGDKRIPLHGGWHDAGDLSQGLVNTSESTSALLQLADSSRATHPVLAAALGAEANQGLQWILQTRFNDGFRATWATMDFWTDGVLGTADDAPAKAGDAAFDTLVATLAEAQAARRLRSRDPIAARRALDAAVADWGHARRKGGFERVDLASAAIRAAVELHRATADASYRDAAAKLGQVLLDSQCRETPGGWSVPLKGFFYDSPARRRSYRFAHRGHDESPVVALVELCTAFPDHPNAPAWKESVRLNADYLRATAALNAPWNMPCAGIYALTEGDAAFQSQVRQGIPLSETHYLRRFPVWGEMRGNSGILLSQAKALSAAGLLLNDTALLNLAWTQLEWHLGRNPFAQSLLYGVGHNFTPQYTAMSGDITGGLPVGIQTRRDEDTPYWPASNCYNYAEIWVHPSARLLSVLADLGLGGPP